MLLRPVSGSVGQSDRRRLRIGQHLRLGAAPSLAFSPDRATGRQGGLDATVRSRTRTGRIARRDLRFCRRCQRQSIQAAVGTTRGAHLDDRLTAVPRRLRRSTLPTPGQKGRTQRLPSDLHPEHLLNLGQNPRSEIPHPPAQFITPVQHELHHLGCHLAFGATTREPPQHLRRVRAQQRISPQPQGARIVTPLRRQRRHLPARVQQPAHRHAVLHTGHVARNHLDAVQAQHDRQHPAGLFGHIQLAVWVAPA